MILGGILLFLGFVLIEWYPGWALLCFFLAMLSAGRLLDWMVL